jgi:hypothetical protein
LSVRVFAVPLDRFGRLFALFMGGPGMDCRALASREC